MSKILLFDVSEILSDSISLKNHMNIKSTVSHKIIGGSLEFFSIVRDVCLKFVDYLPVFCIDGGISPSKRELDSNYKTYNKYFSESRALSNESDAPEREQYLSQYEIIRKVLGESIRIDGVSGQTIKINGIERDQLLGNISSDKDNEYIIVSDDDDLAQLLSENVSLYRPFEDTLVYYRSFMINFELNSIEDLITNKAVSGDYLDMVKGCCVGVGDTYVSDLLRLAKITNFDIASKSQEEIKSICQNNDIHYRSAYINFNLEKFNNNKTLYNLRIYNKDIANNASMIANKQLCGASYISNLYSKIIESNDIPIMDLKKYHITYRYSC